MDDLLIAVRAIVSLAAVLGVLLWVTHRLKKRQTGDSRPGRALPRPLARLTALIPARPARVASPASRPERITVVARSGLGGKAQLVVAEFGGIRYVLGVTEHGISVVDTQEPSASWDADAGESPLKSVA
ncbi:flagellar biosynthetic protein FliO [Microbacterium sp.]|uniref:flagellar biosynthetic protein FliO n=1 Tax=Microbacterium sp. TaxID=51671 RepID=UPI003F70706A